MEPRVYKNLRLFVENKVRTDELFDRLTVRKRNEERLIFHVIFVVFFRLVDNGSESIFE